ncbi:MAG: ABC transporter permease [Nonomuraea sp.]|nr:ABC transporter permease [Nonomuraea sp.]NUS05940.1 ABC transporter permease [Nonomuraea sp.]
MIKRLGTGLAVLWAAATASYLALLLAPGDTVDILVGDGPDTPEIRARIVQEWGLDRPEIVQYLGYLWRLLRGDLGRSYQLQLGVGEVLATQILPTAQLTLAAAGVGVALAGVIAVVTAGRGRLLRGAASLAELVSVSVPPFLIGIVLLSVFSFTLGWFPVSGAAGPGALVLPALALGLPIAGVLGQVLRGGLERALEQPFAVTARARGLTERALVARHALRHALIPAVTLAGWFTGTLLGGAVITEVLFGRPGLGRVAMDAVTGRDMPVVMAVVLLSAVVYVTISTLLDLAYRVIDPRTRG